MRNGRKKIRFRAFLRAPGLLAAVTCLCLAAPAADLKLPTLKTEHGNFTNVVITGRTDTYIYIRYDGGMRNIKLSDINDDAALIALGLKAAPVEVEKVAPVADVALPATNAPPQIGAAATRYQELALAKWKELESLEVPALVLFSGLAALLGFYLFGCYCLKLICMKAGHDPGGLIWIPVLQMIPAFRAAGMSAWWLLALFIPLLNLVAHILWCFKISSARGKSAWVAIALLLPVFNLFAFLYLAFSDAKK